MNEEAVKKLTLQGCMVGRESAEILTEADVEKIKELEVTPMYVSIELLQKVRKKYSYCPECGNEEKWKQVYSPNIEKGDSNYCGECKRLLGDNEHCVVHLEENIKQGGYNNEFKEFSQDFDEEMPIWKCLQCGNKRQGGW